MLGGAEQLGLAVARPAHRPTTRSRPSGSCVPRCRGAGRPPRSARRGRRAARPGRSSSRAPSGGRPARRTSRRGSPSPPRSGPGRPSRPAPTRRRSPRRGPSQPAGGEPQAVTGQPVGAADEAGGERVVAEPVEAAAPPARRLAEVDRVEHEAASASTRGRGEHDGPAVPRGRRDRLGRRRARPAPHVRSSGGGACSRTLTARARQERCERTRAPAAVAGGRRSVEAVRDGQHASTRRGQGRGRSLRHASSVGGRHRGLLAARSRLSTSRRCGARPEEKRP